MTTQPPQDQPEPAPNPPGGAPVPPAGDPVQGPSGPRGAIGDAPPAPVPQETLQKAVTEAKARTVRAQWEKNAAGARKAKAQADLAELKLQHAKERQAAEAAGRPVPLPATVACLPPEAVEKCRAALAISERSPKPFTQAPHLRKAAGVDQHTAHPVWVAYKAGLLPPTSAPWVAGAGPTGRVLPKGRKAENLVKRLTGARTTAEVGAVIAEVGAMLIMGEFDKGTADSLRAICEERRKGLADEAKRRDPLADPDDRRMGLVSPEAFEAAKSIDHLGDDRREMVFDFIGTMLEQENAAARERAPTDEPTKEA